MSLARSYKCTDTTAKRFDSQRNHFASNPFVALYGEYVGDEKREGFHQESAKKQKKTNLTRECEERFINPLVAFHSEDVGGEKHEGCGQESAENQSNRHLLRLDAVL